MARWEDVERSAGKFAAAVRTRFGANRHAVMATLRKDGSPRVSGIETTFALGDLWLGMMPDSRKAQDLRRDPRLALHTSSPDPPEDEGSWEGDAKLSGTAEEITDPGRIAEVAATMAAGQAEPGGDTSEPLDMQLFRVDVGEAVVTRVGDPPDHLVIESWRPGEGVRRVKRT
jgi:hypothetical protein